MCRNQFISRIRSFNSVDDARDFLSHGIKDGNDWLAANNWKLCECYRVGDLSVVLRYRVPEASKDYELVFLAIPVGNYDGERDRRFSGLVGDERRTRSGGR